MCFKNISVQLLHVSEIQNHFINQRIGGLQFVGFIVGPMLTFMLSQKYEKQGTNIMFLAKVTRSKIKYVPRYKQCSLNAQR